jgi:hypothetical protein
MRKFFMPDNASQRQDGSALTLVLIAVLVCGLLGSLIFGLTAYQGKQDYKTKSDDKSAAAVSAALSAQKFELQKSFDEQSKSPYKTFKGPVTYGTITFNYPKSWSAYVEQGDTSKPINAYFYPDQVPGTQSDTAYALRVELNDSAYDQAVSQFSDSVKTGKLTATAYIPPKLNGVANVQPGTLLSGAISDNKTGSMLIIQTRDKTLQIYTESKDFVSDFNNVILPSLTFAP